MYVLLVKNVCILYRYTNKKKKQPLQFTCEPPNSKNYYKWVTLLNEFLQIHIEQMPNRLTKGLTTCKKGNNFNNILVYLWLKFCLKNVPRSLISFFNREISFTVQVYCYMYQPCPALNVKRRPLGIFSCMNDEVPHR